MAGISSPVGYARIATLVLGVIVLGVGLHSHFQSTWTKDLGAGTPLAGSVHLYDLCSSEMKDWRKLNLDKPCPHISLERYFVAMVIITFIVSLILLAGSFFIDLSSQPLRLVDLGYHGVAAVLLFIAAITYIVSAEQINSLNKLIIYKIEVNFLRGEKLAAGALTIIQALLYGVTALLITRQSS